MGIPGVQMARELEEAVPSCRSTKDSDNAVFVVAPKSATFLDRYIHPSAGPSDLQLVQLWSYSKHLNLDDLDFGDDGVIPTLRRVIGRRGLAVWKAGRTCD